MTDMLKNCQLCPRACGADRTKSRGACGAGIEIEAARASLHMWEEPPISGTNGSGTVFFSHCSLGCVFCQNRKISRREAEGQNITADALAKTFLSLEKKVRITSTLLPAPIMCRKLSKRCKLPENRGFRFLLYTIPADMSRWKRCSCSMVTLTSICRITSITAATMQVCTRMRRITVSSPFRLLMKWCARQVHRNLIKMVC